MSETPRKPASDMALFQLLPNMMTLAAICAGLSAIRFGEQGNYVLSVQLILAAAVLDGLDGRLARLINSDSSMGAELDSLADFLNFGVAPPLILFFWALEDTRSLGWISVLIFAVCCVLRLSRFNVAAKSEKTSDNVAFFQGVPAPAGALLAMLPMFVSFAFADAPLVPDLVICGHLVLVGLLMISSIPTWSFKKTRVSRRSVKYFLVGGTIIGAAVLTYPWETLIALCLAYVGTVLWALTTPPKPKPAS